MLRVSSSGTLLCGYPSAVIKKSSYYPETIEFTRKQSSVDRLMIHCPSCESAAGVEFFHHPSVPASNVARFCNREAATQFPRASLRLCCCQVCGLIFNADFDPSLAPYTENHEDSQGSSPHFKDFATSLCERWIERYNLHGGRILEVGCGKMEFLALLCTLADATGVGIDPVARLDRLPEDLTTRLEVIRDEFGPRYLDIDADMLVCRHSLEHIPAVGTFLTDVRRWCERRPSAVVCFELPDVERVLAEVAFWDVYYEHCSYFTRATLITAFELAGLEVLECSRVYDDQYLVIEAQLGEVRPPRLGIGEAMLEDARRFAAEFDEQVTRAQKNIAVLADDRRVAIWGASSKAVALLNALQIDQEIAFAVDVNPHMQGKYMVGSGHRVVAPADLVEDRPDTVVIMNPVYQAEIAATLDALKLSPRLLTVNDLLRTELVG